MPITRYQRFKLTAFNKLNMQVIEFEEETQDPNRLTQLLNVAVAQHPEWVWVLSIT